jgi:hypothetical protein
LKLNTGSPYDGYYIGKGTAGDSSTCPMPSNNPANQGTLCTLYTYVAGSFQSENKYISLTSAFKQHFKVTGNTATFYFYILLRVPLLRRRFQHWTATLDSGKSRRSHRNGPQDQWPMEILACDGTQGGSSGPGFLLLVRQGNPVVSVATSVAPFSGPTLSARWEIVVERDSQRMNRLWTAICASRRRAVQPGGMVTSSPDESPASSHSPRA